MCGRYSLQRTAEKLKKRFNLDGEVQFSPAREIFPSNQAPVIIKKKGKKQLNLFRWGFSPSFTNNLIINARGETVEQKNTFRKPFYQQRCLIPAAAFFEWMETNRGKVKYRISLKESDIFSFAGIFELFADDDGNSIPSFCIITTSAAEKIKPIHHRMPAILTPEEEKIWLDTEEDKTTLLKKCLTRSQQELILKKEN